MPASLRAIQSAPGTADTAAWEQQLVERIRAGDGDAFDALVLHFTRPLRAYVTGVVASDAAAEELVQDVFLNIWRRREAWHVRSNLRSYLFQAAHNAALVHARRGRVTDRWKRGVIARNEVPVMGTRDEPADRRAEVADLDTALRHAIDRLPVRCRQVAILRFIHDLSYPDVAMVMGVTVKAVERHAAKALRVLRSDMGRHLGR